jgi:hypothetical protein
MALLAGDRAVETVKAVDASVLPFFRAAATKLLEVRGRGHAGCANRGPVLRSCVWEWP